MNKYRPFGDLVPGQDYVYVFQPYFGICRCTVWEKREGSLIIDGASIPMTQENLRRCWYQHAEFFQLFSDLGYFEEIYLVGDLENVVKNVTNRKISFDNRVLMAEVWVTRVLGSLEELKGETKKEEG